MNNEEFVVASLPVNKYVKRGEVTSNATHTGEVTGATALTVDKTAITNKTAVTAVGTDYVLLSDTSDSGNLKKALVSDFGGGGTPGGSDTQIQFNDGGSFGGDSALTWDKTSNAINLTGDIYIETTDLASDRYISINNQAAVDTNAGDLNILGGNGNGVGKGSDVVIYSGNGGTSGDGGILDIRSGSGGTTGSAGYFNLQGGDGNGAGKTGGSFYLTSGGGLNGAGGGEIYFTLGQATGGGTKGSFKVNTNGSRAGILDFDSITTTDKTFTFPDASGTLALADGWNPATGTWTYASSTTFTVPANDAAGMAIGDKIKFTQTTVKYFSVIGISGTTITVTGGTDYTVANATISSPFWSHAASPVGHPDWYNYTPTVSAGTGTFTTVSSSARFKITGRCCTFIAVTTTTTVGTAASETRLTLPVTASGNPAADVTGNGLESFNSGDALVCRLRTTTSLGIRNYVNGFAGGNNSVQNTNITYEI